MYAGTEWAINDTERLEKLFESSPVAEEVGSFGKGIFSYLPNLVKLKYGGRVAEGFFEQIAEGSKLEILEIGCGDTKSGSCRERQELIDLAGIEYCSSLKILNLDAKRINQVSLLSHLKLTELVISFSAEVDQPDFLRTIDGEFLNHLEIRADYLPKSSQSSPEEELVSYQEALDRLLGGSFPKLKSLTLTHPKPNTVTIESIDEEKRCTLQHLCQDELLLFHARQVLASMGVYESLRTLMQCLYKPIDRTRLLAQEESDDEDDEDDEDDDYDDHQSSKTLSLMIKGVFICKARSSWNNVEAGLFYYLEC